MLLDSVVCYGFEDFGNEPYMFFWWCRRLWSKQFSRCQPNQRSRWRKMDVDYKHGYISSEEHKQRQIFIHLFRSGKYLTANSMYESRKLKWLRSKIYDTYDYKLYYSFKSDRRHSSPSRGKKLSEKASLKYIELLEENNISSRKISNILREENLVDVSKTTIVNALKN